MILFKSKIRLKAEKLRAKKVYERAELARKMTGAILNRQELFIRDLHLERDIRLLDEILET